MFQVSQQWQPNNCELQDESSHEERYWQGCKTFIICLTTSTIITAIGIAIISAIFIGRLPPKAVNSETPAPQHPYTPTTQPPAAEIAKNVDVTFQYVMHLWKSQVEEFEGGDLRCARYRMKDSDYASEEARLFGASIHEHQSQISLCILRIKRGGLRVPHWNLQANTHGFVSQGTVWIGVMHENGEPAITYNVTCGQIFFIPRNNLHWIKNIGDVESVIVLFFSTHNEFFTAEVDLLFSSTPEDILTRTLNPKAGVDFIRGFRHEKQGNIINLPQNLTEPATRRYPQSENKLVWKYFYDLEGARKLVYNGGEITWAGFYKNNTGRKESEVVYGESLSSHPDTLSLGVLRLRPFDLWLPHYHLNAHEMGYVLRGCGKVGLINEEAVELDIGIGDVVYFPIGTQHYVKNTCEEDLILIRAFSISVER
ncbi:oxalate decarboxylase OxdC-like [Spea bombifrons]|uniref:oxalate decarboxylase OxdC-like n=1 Tax=Spea bombifrons TaxID=233779 RepID=UPI00234BC6E1|nr:oxalate decarboxylase OxdC-like [Spea bombifrons]